jgi:flagellar protein FliS
MLYDGAIAAMNRAVASIEMHDIHSKCTHLKRALAIIAQLEGTLNFEQGGEVAQTLKSLYTYARTQVLKANLENSAEILRALIGKLSNVREAWSEADHRTATTRANVPGDESSGEPVPPPLPAHPDEPTYGAVGVEAANSPATLPPAPPAAGANEMSLAEPLSAPRSSRRRKMGYGETWNEEMSVSVAPSGADSGKGPSGESSGPGERIPWHTAA